MKRIKYAVDAAMMFMLILLLGRNITGAQNHELIGISMMSLFAIHIILNIKWFLNFKKILKNSGNSLLNVLWMLVNVFLIVDLVIMFVSAVVVSDYVFSFAFPGRHRAWEFVHGASAYAGLMLMSVHLGMHWNMIMSSLRKAWKLKDNKVRRVILRAVLVLVILFGINASFTRGVGDKFTYYFEEKEQEEKEDYIGNLYLDYMSIAAIYISGAHYTLKIIDKAKRKRK